MIDEIVTRIPRSSLAIAFIDPYSLGIHFETVGKLAAFEKMDLIILFADRMDIVRNVDAYYSTGRSDRLDLFYGRNSKWRRRYDALHNRSSDHVCDFFVSVYLEQLATFGYRHTRTKAIREDKGALYRLVYASKNPLGLKFWDIAASYDRAGGKDFLF